jgi:hypothetical protein
VSGLFAAKPNDNGREARMESVSRLLEMLPFAYAEIVFHCVSFLFVTTLLVSDIYSVE